MLCFFLNSGFYSVDFDADSSLLARFSVVRLRGRLASSPLLLFWAGTSIETCSACHVRFEGSFATRSNFVCYQKLPLQHYPGFWLVVLEQGCLDCYGSSSRHQETRKNPCFAAYFWYQFCVFSLSNLLLHVYFIKTVDDV